MYPKPTARYRNLPEPFSKTWELRAKAILADQKKQGKKILLIAGSDPVDYGHKNQSISKYLIEAAEEGWHMYPHRSPWPAELRAAITEFEKKHRNVEYSTEDIILTPGCGSAWATLHYNLLETVDDVLVPEPAHYLWSPADIFPMFGTNIVPSPCIEDKGWDIDLEDMRKKITSKTKYIVLENPCNPTGTIYSDKTLKGVVDIAGENEVPIIADEIYGMITYDGHKTKSIAEVAGDVPTIVISGMSKFFMRTGWRIGYIAVHDTRQKIAEIKASLKKYATMYGHATTGMPTPVLAAAAKAYRAPLDGSFEFVKTLQPRRDFAFKRLNEIDGISAVKPNATLYIFPHVQAANRIWKNDTDFLMDLAKEEGVLFVPGSFFGPTGAFHFRCLVLPEIEVLAEAFDRLEGFLKRHKAIPIDASIKSA